MRRILVTIFLFATAITATVLYFGKNQKVESKTMASSSEEFDSVLQTDVVTQQTLGFLEVQIGMKMDDYVSGRKKMMPMPKPNLKNKNETERYFQHASHVNHGHEVVRRYFIRNPKQSLEIEIPDNAIASQLTSGGLVAFVLKDTINSIKTTPAKIISESSPTLKSATAASTYELVFLKNDTILKSHSKYTNEIKELLAKHTYSTPPSYKLENIGVQRTLIIPFHNPSSTIDPDVPRINQLFFPTTGNSLNAWVLKWSRGLAQLMGDTANPILGPRCVNNETSGTASYAVEQIDKMDEADLAAIDRLVILFPRYSADAACNGYIWGTIGKTTYFLKNGRIGNFSISWLYDSASPSSFLYGAAHELGHNLTLNHANALYCGSGDVSQPGCSNSEYSDSGQFMGMGGYADMWVSGTQISQMGWDLGDSVPGTPGTYTLRNLSNPSGTTGIMNVSLPINWGRGAGSVYGRPTMAIDYHSGTDEYLRGVFIRYHWGLGHTYSPDIYAYPNGVYQPVFNRKLVNVGDTYTDKVSGWKVTLNSKNQSSAVVNIQKVAPQLQLTNYSFVQIQNGQQLFGNPQLCNELYVDVNEHVAGALNDKVLFYDAHRNRWPDITNCDFYQRIGTVNRYRCQNIDYTYSGNISIMPSQNMNFDTFILKADVPAYGCSVATPKITSITVNTGEENPVGYSCDYTQIRVNGTNIPAGLPVYITLSEVNGQANYQCSGATAGLNYFDCNLAIDHNKKWWVSVTIGNNYGFTSINNWTCAGEVPYKFDVLKTVQNPDKIFGSGFEGEGSSGTATQYCSQVKASVIVNHRYSGKQLKVMARNMYNYQSTEECNLNIPVFSSGERTLNCTFNSLDPNKEHYIQAQIGADVANGVYGSWSCER